MNAGEYMTGFKEKYELIRYADHSGLLEGEEGIYRREVLDILGKVEAAKLLRGKGGEVLRVAICRLIEGISIAKLPLDDEQIV